jgi:hypothetical protein
MKRLPLATGISGSGEEYQGAGEGGEGGSSSAENRPANQKCVISKIREKVDDRQERRWRV